MIDFFLFVCFALWIKIAHPVPQGASIHFRPFFPPQPKSPIQKKSRVERFCLVLDLETYEDMAFIQQTSLLVPEEILSMLSFLERSIWEEEIEVLAKGPREGEMGFQ